MDLIQENRIWRRGYRIVAGVDEAGRGPLAGPVFAGAVAVILNLKSQNSRLRPKTKNLLRVMRDSKKLAPRQREEIYEELISNPFVVWGVGRVGPRMIEKINILEASKLAMARAVKNLERKLGEEVEFLLLDGNFKISLKISQLPIIRGDQKIFSIAAASIIAKVRRDRLMLKYHRQYPDYGWDINKGYPTKVHLEAIRKIGPCEMHRKTFGPVRGWEGRLLCGPRVSAKRIL